VEAEGERADGIGSVRGSGGERGGRGGSERGGGAGGGGGRGTAPGLSAVSEKLLAALGHAGGPLPRLPQPSHAATGQYCIVLYICNVTISLYSTPLQYFTPVPGALRNATVGCYWNHRTGACLRSF